MTDLQEFSLAPREQRVSALHQRVVDLLRGDPEGNTGSAAHRFSPNSHRNPGQGPSNRGNRRPGCGLQSDSPAAAAAGPKHHSKGPDGGDSDEDYRGGSPTENDGGWSKDVAGAVEGCLLGGRYSCDRGGHESYRRSDRGCLGAGNAEWWVVAGEEGRRGGRGGGGGGQGEAEEEEEEVEEESSAERVADLSRRIALRCLHMEQQCLRRERARTRLFQEQLRGVRQVCSVFFCFLFRATTSTDTVRVSPRSGY